jgi:hypothetical protein
MAHTAESLYRNYWLAAHTRLHDAVHKGTPVTKAFFQEYLSELRTLDKITDASLEDSILKHIDENAILRR